MKLFLYHPLNHRSIFFYIQNKKIFNALKKKQNSPEFIEENGILHLAVYIFCKTVFQIASTTAMLIFFII